MSRYAPGALAALLLAAAAPKARTAIETTTLGALLPRAFRL